jgi:hypothetical protein
MIANPGAASRRIARAASTVMVAFVFSNLVGLLRQVLVAKAFGTSPEMEATAASRVSETILPWSPEVPWLLPIPTFTLAHPLKKKARPGSSPLPSPDSADRMGTIGFWQLFSLPDRKRSAAPGFA